MNEYSFNPDFTYGWATTMIKEPYFETNDVTK